MSGAVVSPVEAGSPSRRFRNWTPAFAGVAVLLVSGCATAPVRIASRTTAPMAVPAVPSAGAASVPPGMQYLYGSGEGAAISIQAWRGLVGYVAAQARARPVDSVVLAEGATLAAPRFTPCGQKPLAVVFDVDETVLLNLGFESDEAAHPGRAYDEARWQAWERTGGDKVAPVPGAVRAIEALRAIGVTVVFNTNRSAGNAAASEAALNGAGLGPARHGDTLFLKGDDNTGSLKDARRWRIAERYCVLAMGGDQLGDFSDLFNAGQPVRGRRALVSGPGVASRWGAGWFVLPNPVYGTAMKGGVNDLFPSDKKWSAPHD